MRFALIDQQVIEAAPGLKAVCPGCLQPVIAKCGTQKIHHWAHASNKNCDNWWEPETAWHRAWKNNYPDSWQEKVHHDEQTGKKHIADIRTTDNLVIEFQHSPLEPAEQDAREQFYKNMIWVVDGGRLKTNFPRFLKGRKDFAPIKEGQYRVDIYPETFPSGWHSRAVPVIFDFSSDSTTHDPLGLTQPLYCLFPHHIGRYGLLAEFSRQTFINTTSNGEWLRRTSQLLAKRKQEKELWDQLRKKEQQYRDNMLFQRFTAAVRQQNNGKRS